MAVNYQMDVINPFQAALQGYGAGAQMLQQERTAERQVRQDEQQSQLFQAQMQEAQLRAQQARQAMANAERVQAASAKAFEAVKNGELSSDLIVETYAASPELGKFLQTERDRLNTESRQNIANQNLQVATALENNQIEIAKQLYEKRAVASENAGDPEGAAAERAMAKQLDTPDGVDVVKTISYMTAGSLLDPKDFDQSYKNIQAMKGEQETEAVRTARTYALTFGAPGSPAYMKAFQTKLLPPPAQGTTVIVGGEGKPLSELQKALDKKFAEDTMLPFITGGATNDMAKVDKLVGAIATLEANPNLTGPYVGWLPDAALAVVSPDLLATKETIQDVASANLKLILGGQFGEKEGERLINRAFNQSLPASENIKRAKRMLTQVQAANEDIRRAIAYVEDPEKNGSLQGFRYSTKTGKNWTEQDFIDAIEGKNQPATINFKAMDDDTLLRQDTSKLNKKQRDDLDAVLTERGYD
jgi:phage tail protein X